MNNHHDNPENSLIRANFVSLGCAKNLIDSEKMLAHLVESGIALVSPDDPADVTIINTCGFIEDARTEAAEAITDALQAKKSGATAHVIVTGCLAQYQPQKLQQQFPQIDAVIGLSHRSQIASLVRQIATPKKGTFYFFHHKKEGAGVFSQVEPFRGRPFHDQVRLRLTDPGWAYLRISEGCNRDCSFCTIPQIRGPYRSKPLDDVLAEAAELIADGAVELNLIGQETSSYGADLNPNLDLTTLLHELNQLDGLRWIRLLYAHPATLTTAHIEAIAACDKVLPYLDLPLQHINNRILRLMHRRITRSQTEKLLQNLRRTIPNLTLRTTMLVGFPSETDAEFAELIDFIRQYPFEALGGFIYSPEDNTPAAQVEPAIPLPVKQQRYQQLMLTQQPLAFAHADSLLNQTVTCLICRPLDPTETADLKLDPQQNVLLARHPGQAPEIDGACYLTAPPSSELDSGAVVTARLTQRIDYDLMGAVIPK